MIPDRMMNWLMRIEGGKADDPVDRGGKTNMGITAGTANRAFKEGLIPSPDPYDLTREQAHSIYYHYYYLPSQCHKLDWPLNLIHFDSAVNHGIGGAGILLQRTLNILNSHAIHVDGSVGPQTLMAYGTALHEHGVERIADVYLIRRKGYYHLIVHRRPEQKRFIGGWLNRIDLLKQEIAKG